MVSQAGLHLAEFNVGRTVAPLDDPRLADFMAALDGIDALAEASAGPGAGRGGVEPCN